MKSECMCEDCKSACKNKPGWFMPGEAEKAAESLGLSLKEFFDKYLGVDWWEADQDAPNDLFVLAPSTTRMNAGSMYPASPRGACVFYEHGLCTIHPVKPFECAEMLHDQTHEYSHQRHLRVAKAWEAYHDQIVSLLGEEPYTSSYGLFDSLFDMMD